MEVAVVMYFLYMFPGKKVFGVPLMVNVQRHGHALPPLILQAMEHIKKTGLVHFYFGFLQLLYFACYCLLQKCGLLVCSDELLPSHMWKLLRN